MFGSDELDVTGSRNVNRYAPNTKRVVSQERGRMVGWRDIKVTGSPVTKRSVPRGLTARIERVPDTSNQGANEMFGLHGGRFTIPEDIPLESFMDSVDGVSGITDLIKDTSATVDQINETVDKYAPTVKQIIDAAKGTQATPTPTVATATTFAPSVAAPKPNFFSTPMGMTVAIGGGLLVLGGIYMATKK